MVELEGRDRGHRHHPYRPVRHERLRIGTKGVPPCRQILGSATCALRAVSSHLLVVSVSSSSTRGQPLHVEQPVGVRISFMVTAAASIPGGRRNLDLRPGAGEQIGCVLDGLGDVGPRSDVPIPVEPRDS